MPTAVGKTAERAVHPRPAVNPERMTRNLTIFDFTLTEQQMARIAGMDTWTTLFFDHRDPAIVSLIGHRPIHD